MQSRILSAILLLTVTIAHSQAPVVQWSRGFGSALGAGAPGIATDANGNVYATGVFEGSTLTFGNTTLTNQAMDSASNAYLVKYDSSGNALWAQSIGGGDNEGTEAITSTGLGADANGNVFVLGSYETPIAIFGHDTLATNNSQVFLVKYNPQGAAIWAVNVGTQVNNASYIAVDAEGNSYITGLTTAGGIVGGNDTLPFAGYIEGYVVKYDSNGHSIWARVITGENVFNDAVSVDAAQNVYVTGDYTGDSVVISNSITLTNTGAHGMYTVKYDNNGNALWAQNVSVAVNIFPTGITTDAAGNVYLHGNTSSDTLVFGADTAFTFASSANNVSNIFIAAYSSTGVIKWVHCTQNNNNAYSGNISSTAGGNVFITGNFSGGALKIGNTTLPDNSIITGSGSALYVAQYDANGNATWVSGGIGAINASDGGYSVLADNNGHLYLWGNYSGNNVVFGADTLPFLGTPAAQTNMFVTKYDITETPTAVSNITSNPGQVTVYPNPSTGRFYFKGISTGSLLQVYNVLGQVIYSVTATDDIETISLSTQAKGIYLYRVVSTGAPVQQGKIVLE